MGRWKEMKRKKLIGRCKRKDREGKKGGERKWKERNKGRRTKIGRKWRKKSHFKPTEPPNGQQKIDLAENLICCS